MADDQIRKLSNNLKKEESKLSLLGYRHLFAVLGFLVFFSINAQRLSFAVAIVAMVNHTALNEYGVSHEPSCPISNNSSDTPLKLDGPFAWNSELQGYILAAEFVGFMIMQPLAGKVSEYVRPIWIIICGCFLSALTSIATPFASYWHEYLVIAVQAIRGMSQGALVPPMYVLMGNWFPASERGFLSTFVITGFAAGSFTGGLVSGWICDIQLLGWQSTFYILAILSVLVAILFGICFTENPYMHHGISKEELFHITGSLVQKETNEKRMKSPWNEIFRSIPVYALIIGMLGSYWIMSYFLTVHPTYLGTILHLNMSENGLLSSLPFLLRLLGGWGSSWLSDWLSRNDYSQTNTLRKWCNTIGSFGFCVSIIGAYFVECDRYLNTIFFIIGSFFTGATLSGCIIVSVDMSPKFAGPLIGIVSGFGTFAFIIVPILTGYITTEMKMEEWKILFLINAGVVMTCAIVFVLFGSAEVQPWNSYGDIIPESKLAATKIYAENTDLENSRRIEVNSSGIVKVMNDCDNAVK